VEIENIGETQGEFHSEIEMDSLGWFDWLTSKERAKKCFITSGIGRRRELRKLCGQEMENHKMSTLVMDQHGVLR
jgi:hypothetical protein